MESSSTKLLSTRNSKPCLIIDGYQHRLHRRNKVGIGWVCVKDKKNCKGNAKTNLQYEVIIKTHHFFVPNIAEIEAKEKMENCRKMVKEEVSLPVRKMYTYWSRS
jgi:hypothetical protein